MLRPPLVKFGYIGLMTHMQLQYLQVKKGGANQPKHGSDSRFLKEVLSLSLSLHPDSLQRFKSVTMCFQMSISA